MGAAVKLFLVAGEASGDALGAALLDGLDALAPGTERMGVGGAAMAERGLGSLFPMDELSVMGLVEVLPRYRALRRRIAQAAQAAIEGGADALVTIDSPDFCLRVAKLVKAARPDMPVIHYVAPSVWAWRPGRAARMARHVDHVLALLPFEPPYMEAAGMTCDFVGHPAAAEALASDEEIALFRRTRGIETGAFLILPGSRPGEIARLGPVFGIAASLVLQGRPDLTPIVPVAPGRLREAREMASRWTFDPILADMADPETRRAAFGAGTVALAASGTVSLDLARAGVPMVVAYDVHPISRVIMQRMATVDTVTLVNLVSGTRAVPEFIGARCTPGRIAPAVARAARGDAAQSAAMRAAMERLGAGGEAPGRRAARSVLAAVGRLTAR